MRRGIPCLRKILSLRVRHSSSKKRRVFGSGKGLLFAFHRAPDVLFYVNGDRKQLDLAKTNRQLGYVYVKTGKLRDQLSHYLKRVRQTGDSIIVMDRNHPVAEIRPYQDPLESQTTADVWTRRAYFEKKLSSLDEDFELPRRQTAPAKHRNPLDL